MGTDYARHITTGPPIFLDDAASLGCKWKRNLGCFQTFFSWLVSKIIEPKLHNDRGPLESRINRDIPPWLPWLPGSAPISGTAHRNRPFIAGNSASKNEKNSTNYWPNQGASEMRDEEEASENDISTDEVEDEFRDHRNKQQK